MARYVSCPALAALVIAMSLVPRTGGASGEPGDPRCSGFHSFWSPVPDDCLGVIDTDRPHQTDTPHVVPAGHTQFESSVLLLELGHDINDPHGPSSTHVGFLDDEYTFGLVSRVDLQLLERHAEYIPATRTFVPPGPLEVRFKFSFLDGGGLVPAMTFVPWVFIPMAPPPIESLRAGPALFLAWDLPLHFELEMNVGVLFSEKPKPAEALILASALTYTFPGNFSVFFECYATGDDVALGTGALWAFARDMQIDLGTNIGVGGAELVATPFLGFSIRR